MPKFNDLDLNNWKKLENIRTDSLWIMPNREKGGKHSNIYHGNFVPQIAYQLINRYTRKGNYVLDFFVGSGTTAIECENLGRNVIGVDIRKDLIDRLNKLIDGDIRKKFITGDATKKVTLNKVQSFLEENNKENVDLVILHPPYFDIIKFSEKKEDLSNTNSLNDFLTKFSKVLENSKKILKKDGYMAIVIGDKYQKGERIPLGFYCMYQAQKTGLTLKSVIVKNIEGNRGKQGSGGIWRYRALSSDYYLFKHEYILVFKK